MDTIKLTHADYEKARRLRTVFDRNYRITHLFRAYLTNLPTLLTADMITALTEEGEEPVFAVAALLAEAFGLDTEDSAEDRVLFRDYLIPAVHILRAEDYEADPYFRTVNVPALSDGNWTFRTETLAPYQAAVCGDVVTFPDGREVIPLGFFTTPFSYPAVLENGNTWMTLTPVDVDTCRDAIARARGNVITFGLGLGYFAFAASEKPEVTQVTVIEKSEDIIRLFETHLLPQFPHREKIRVIHADAFAFAEWEMPKEFYDFAFVDTWRDASDGAEMYRRMKPLEEKNPGTEFAYWIEEFLLSATRAEVFEEIWANLLPGGTSGEPNATIKEIRRAISSEGLRKFCQKGGDIL